MATSSTAWPDLSGDAWRPTCTTLHLWSQIVGKVRLALTPWINHSWHATLYVTARGLTTGTIPHGDRTFQIDLDFVDHALVIQAADGAERRLELAPRSVADVHAAVLQALADLGLAVQIHGAPSEIPDAVPFHEDRVLRPYDGDEARRYWRALVQADRVFKQFRTSFLGKASPVHLFWGAFDLAVTRFSGRTAPRHKGGIPNLPDEVAQEAYSHEVSSAGFWPGGGGVDGAAIYSYAYPEPPGFRSATVQPAAASFHEALGEFVLPYDAVSTAAAPDDVLLGFLQSTYEAAASLAGWERRALECAPGRPGVTRVF